MASARLLAYAPLLLLVAATMLTLAAYAWQNRDAAGATPLTGLLVGMAAWAGFYGLGLLTQDVGTRLLWLRLNWTGSAFVPLFWLLFALEYSGRTERVTPVSVAALAVVPVATVVLAWTAPLHDLMWRGASIVDLGAVTMLRYESGAWYTVFDVYTYLAIGAATWVFVRLIRRRRDMYIDRSVALLLGSFMPAVGYAAAVLGFARQGVDPTPLTFPVTGALFAFVIFRGDLFDAVSTTAAVGQEAAVEAMQDAVVVVDPDGTIIEANPSAADLFGRDPAGADIGAVPPLDAVEFDDSEGTVELSAPDNRTVEATVTPIYDVNDRLAGHAVVLRDITPRKNYRDRLQITGRVLRHNLRNDMAIVMGTAGTIAADADDPEMAERAERIQAAAQSLVDSGTKVRAVERYLDGDAELARRDLVGAATAAVEDARENSDEATIRLSAPPVAHAMTVDGVEAAVEEALDNAVSHAGAQPEVEVTVESRQDAVVVAVADDGPGIPKYERDVVASGRETPLEHVSGAGLWLMKWLVERSGGELTLTVDDGTTVVMRFPPAGE